MIQSEKIEQSIQVNLRHQIIFTENIFSIENQLLAELLDSKFDESFHRSKVAFFIDSGLIQANPNLVSQIRCYCRKFLRHLSEDFSDLHLIVPGGENCKQDRKIFDSIIDFMHASKLCRHSYVIVVGGGCVLDAVCFAASIVHRGIRHIRIPTTVLAQNDAGIGIKNGIDAFEKKNFLGTFQLPDVVINDFSFLQTLDANHWRNGIAEAVKVALIKDPDFFEWIEDHTHSLIKRDLSAMKFLIKKCATLHLEHIATSGDPFEKGSTRPLDFGHWAAHKIEQLSQFKISHGHAVAVGICIDTTYSQKMGLLSKEDEIRVIHCLSNLGFELNLSELGLRNLSDGNLKILEGLSEFREHIGGILCLTMLRKIGSSVEIHEVQLSKMIESIEQVSWFGKSEIHKISGKMITSL